MNQGLTIAATTYRLLGKVFVSALALMALPLSISVGLEYLSKGLKDFPLWLFDASQGLLHLVYVAALLRIILLGHPVSLRALRLGRDEWSMFFISAFIGVLAFLLGMILVVILILSGATSTTYLVVGSLIGTYLAVRFLLLFPLIVVRGSDMTNAFNNSWRGTQGNVLMLIIAGVLTVGLFAGGLELGLMYALGAIHTVPGILQAVAAITVEFAASTVITCLSAVSYQALVEQTETV